MSKGNLLIIDDEILLLEKTAMLLEDIADQVFTSDNGADGIKIIHENKIHCVICDINMPEMNGLEVIKKVRETHKDLPFIFYTGHGSKDIAKEAQEMNVLGFLDKPCLDNLEDLAVKGLSIGLSKS